MESTRQIALRSESTAIVRQSETRLNDADGFLLAEVIAQMADRYPHQDLSLSLEGFMRDFERLAVRYSMQTLMWALAELRIRPGQKFFPQPSEAAEVCEELMAKERQLFLKQHPYEPCQECDGMGMIVRTRSDGSRFAEDCECKKAWRRSCEPVQPAVSDRKAKAAGE